MGLFTQCLQKADQLICSYLGLKTEKTQPTKVVMSNGKMYVHSHQSYKRHQATSDWQSFQKVELAQTSPEQQEQLGVAMGKAVAKDLVVSFDQPKVTPVRH